MEDIVCVTIKVKNSNIVVQNKICGGFECYMTFRNFLEKVIDEWKLEELLPIQSVAVKIEDNSKNSFTIDENETLERARIVTKGIFVKYIIEKDVADKTSDIENTIEMPMQNAFEVIMTARIKNLEPIKVRTKKCELHNQVLKDIQSEGSMLNGGFGQDDGTTALKILTDVIWYLDGRQKTINDASIFRGASVVTPVPERFSNYAGYQNWTAWKKKPKLERQKCEDLSSSVLNVLDKRALNLPNDWRLDIIALSSSMSSYAKYLFKANELQQERQLKLVPSRQLSTHAAAQFFASVDMKFVQKDLRKLSDVVASQDELIPVLIDYDEHFEHGLSRAKIYRLLASLTLTSPVMVIRYDPGGGSQTLTFVFRVPENFNENDRSTSALQILKSLEPEIPTYHTRAMRKSFANKMTSLNALSVQPHYLRHIYRILTGDASAEITSTAIDDRIKFALEIEDPDLITDLRHLNSGRPGDTFKLFFEELNKLVDEKTAVDDRRHGVAHMSEFLSIRDLIEQVTKNIPTGTPIPSESTVLFSFAPPNMHAKTSQYYTAKVNLKHAIQRRQLRAFHTDSHWCNALFRYMREMAIRFRENALFISADDKAKVDFGEPGSALSSGVRGKKSIIPTTSILGALDHDVNQKGSITPTVSLICDIPEDISDSFYRGQVFLTLKDSVFEPSTSFRSILELYHSIQELSVVQVENMKYLFLITDGGPEHRVNFESVKLPLILLYKRLNIDLLVAIRTAPGNSYINIVERIMSILNIGLQNLALERAESNCEDVIRKLRNLEELRSKSSIIKDGWVKSIDPVKKTLEKRMERLSLKGVPFQLNDASNPEQLNEFIEEAANIDPKLPDLIKNKKMTVVDLAKVDLYQNFKRKHCKEGLYSFQIMRRCDEDCCAGGALDGALDWLPYPMPDDDNPGHYKPFNSVFGMEETSEEFIPSKLNNIRKVTEEQQGCKNAMFVGQNVRSFVRCSSCSKPRCVYSSKQLTNRQIRELGGITRKYDFVCGCMITPDVSHLSGIVFTRLELTCETPIEWAYYASQLKEANRDLCCYCRKEDTVVDATLKKSYKSVLPVCKECREKGKPQLKRGPLHTALAQRSIKSMMPKSKKKK